MMAADLRERLRAHFNGSLLIDRELGGGGMSRVFVARDAALGRDVVIKVLPEELQGSVGVDRFRREIHIAAQLQHPHIVPILSAGEVDGLPYLTMPFVEGKSLRSRLIEGGALPIDQAVSILRDVARALDYAHSRGVVHRDIKPDNVLLSHGTATVTDFGVAKAVSAARGDAASTLTGIGMSIGTPMYMAPEQAAGDPDIDGRADIYAWGIVAYELLTGAPPFVHASPQKQLAAHLAETPVDVRERRRACPDALADLVMRCLRKDRDERPATAAEVVDVLGNVGATSSSSDDFVAPSHARLARRAFTWYAGAVILVAILAQAAVRVFGLPDWAFGGAMVVLALGLPVMIATAFVTRSAAGAPPVSSGTGNTMTRLVRRARPALNWRRAAIGGGMSLAGFAIIVVTFMVLRGLGIGPFGSLFARGVMTESEEILVDDFSGPAQDSSLGMVVAEGIRTALAQSKSLRVIPANRVASQLRLMELPPTRHVDLALARQVAEREGVRVVLDGSITSVGQSYIITLRLFGTRDSTQLLLIQESARDAGDIIPAIDRVAHRLREKIGESFTAVRETPRLERVTTASLPALRKYTEGWRLNTIERDFLRAIPPLEEAIALDTTFAIAYRQAALVYFNAGVRLGRIDTLLEAAMRHRGRLPILERSLVEGSYYTYSRNPDRRKAAEAFARAVQADSTQSSALNSLGVLMLEARRPDSAISLFAQITRTNPENSFGFTNLAAALHTAGKTDSAHRVIREALRRFPGNSNIIGWQRIFWTGDRLRDSARTFCGSLTRGGTTTTRSMGYRCLYSLDVMEGRLSEANVESARWVAVNDSIGRTGIPMIALLDSARAQTWLLDRGSAVARRLDEVMARKPLGRDPTSMEAQLLVAEAYALAGRPDRARQILSQFDRDVPDSAQRAAFHTLRQIAIGEVAIAERRYPDAIREFQRADTLADGLPQFCDVCVLPRLARAYDLAERRSEAIASFEAYLASNHQWRRTETDPLYYAGALKRLGELHEAAGNREKAAMYYTRFVDLWRDADAPLQPKVAEARRRLARLETAR